MSDTPVMCGMHPYNWKKPLMDLCQMNWSDQGLNPDNDVSTLVSVSQQVQRNNLYSKSRRKK